jgi:hypothetical protein
VTNQIRLPGRAARTSEYARIITGSFLRTDVFIGAGRYGKGGQDGKTEGVEKLFHNGW